MKNKNDDLSLDPKSNYSPVIIDDRKKFVEDHEKYIASLKTPDGFFKKFIFQVKKRSMINSLAVLKRSVSESVTNEKNILELNDLKHMINVLGGKKWYDYHSWAERIKRIFNKDKVFFINMELRNGKHKHFLIFLEAEYFNYLNARYIIDDEYKYENISIGMYCLDYHQDCCLPLKRRFSLNSIRDSIAQTGEVDTETSINPNTLKVFMESDIIQKVMKGAEMENWLGFVKVMLIVILIAIVITLLMNGYVLFHK